MARRLATTRSAHSEGNRLISSRLRVHTITWRWGIRLGEKKGARLLWHWFSVCSGCLWVNSTLSGSSTNRFQPLKPTKYRCQTLPSEEPEISLKHYPARLLTSLSLRQTKRLTKIKDPDEAEATNRPLAKQTGGDQHYRFPRRMLDTCYCLMSLLDPMFRNFPPKNHAWLHNSRGTWEIWVNPFKLLTAGLVCSCMAAALTDEWGSHTHTPQGTLWNHHNTLKIT